MSSKIIQRFEVGARMSEMSVYNGIAHLAGQVADDAKADISGQTKQVLASIDALLERAGSNKTKILMAQIFLADVADFAAMNAVWDAWVVPGHTPTHASAGNCASGNGTSRVAGGNRGDRGGVSFRCCGGARHCL